MPGGARSHPVHITCAHIQLEHNDSCGYSQAPTQKDIKDYFQGLNHHWK